MKKTAKKIVKKPAPRKPVARKPIAKVAKPSIKSRVAAHVAEVKKHGVVVKAPPAAMPRMIGKTNLRLSMQSKRIVGGTWKGYPLSKYSLDLLEWVKGGKGNAVLAARAGSGKTTNIEMICEFLPPETKIAAICFNKHIAVTLQERLPSNVTACTLNSLGFGICRANRAWKLQADKTEGILKSFFNMDDRDQRKQYYGIRGSICKAVSIFKSQLLMTMPERAQVYTLAARYEIEIPTGGDTEQWFSYLSDVYDISLKEMTIIDFDDQWFLPLLMNWPMPKFDFVMVDEAQDMCPAQIEFIRRLGSSGRVLAVGDEFQAIYGFRGADAQAIAKTSAALEAVRLPLSICYRCGKNIIKLAQSIVSDIEYWDSAPDGEVLKVKEAEYQSKLVDGNLVLCRTMAPLVRQCLSMIRAGRKAVVRGRDIGKNLTDLLRRIVYGAGGSMIEALAEYGRVEANKLMLAKREAEAQAMEDRVETLIALADGCIGVDDVAAKISRIFSDDVVGVTFCTIHRAKGLEADTVALIHPELLPHPMAKTPEAQQQERNLEYVAYTRAMKTLMIVTMEPRK